MKKILKKNQIIITALVVMVAIAGYLSMTDREELTMNGHGDHNKAATESCSGRRRNSRCSQWQGSEHKWTKGFQ